MPVPESVTRLIANSGNNFRARVARWFQANGWHTAVSPYYMDQTQSKAREIDLAAEKLWPITDTFGQHKGDVLVRLFVECKFVAAETVFWFAPKNTDAAEALVCGVWPFRKDNSYTWKLHYISRCPAVAKVFASGNDRAPENDPFFKALNQALNATVALRGQSPSHPSLAGRQGDKLVVLEYPVVVCSSFAQLYGTDFFKEAEPTPIGENFQMEIQYAYLDRGGDQRNDYFLLDFVAFDQLPIYESAITEDANAAAHLA